MRADSGTSARTCGCMGTLPGTYMIRDLWEVRVAALQDRLVYGFAANRPPGVKRKARGFFLGLTISRPTTFFTDTTLASAKLHVFFKGRPG